MGFRGEMSAVMGSLPHLERRMLLSATDAPELPGFVGMEGAVRLDFLREGQATARVRVHRVDCPERDKLETLAHLLCDLGKSCSIVFLNFREGVERVGGYLREKGFTVSLLHGGMDQGAREAAVYRLMNRSVTALVGTDLASRGLDIPGVDNIIHCHLPPGEREYVHRVGRTACWRASGNAFLLLAPGEEVPPYVGGNVGTWRLSGAPGAPPRPAMVTLYIGKGRKDNVSRGDVLGFLCKAGGLESGEIGRIDVWPRCSWAAVDSGRYMEALGRLAGGKIKGMRTIVEPAGGA